MHPMRPVRLPLIAALVAVASIAGFAAVPSAGFDAAVAGEARTSGACPPGYVSMSKEGSTSLAGHVHRAGWCINAKHPEDASELADNGAQQFAKYAAPRTKFPSSSYFTAIRQRNRLLKRGQSAANSNRWTPYGKGPLQSADPDYPGVNGLGLVELAGRITDFAYVPPTDAHFGGALFASVAYGGVWMSKDEGKSWRPIGNRLPTQIVGSVGYTPAGGGTIVAITGDGSFGRYSRPGAGAFWSNDGKTWHHAKGVPSGAFGFNVAVDQRFPKRVYVATGKGLFRSADAGRTFVNVQLPTGDCAGTSRGDCMLANEVTDVVVKAPAGTPARHGGAVLAAVGWRDGDAPYANGKPQAPANGLYFSPHGGKPGTFKKLEPSGFAPQERIGRVEFGPAVGPDQDHNYVYATVQDATLSRGGGYGIDADQTSGTIPSVWEGLYVSSDFGQTWSELYDVSEAQSPTTGSALAVVAQAQANYGPGVQAWYNEWVAPDPTMSAGGVPSRVLFGLEEVWENDDPGAPQDAHSSFHVVGRYYGGSTCLFLPPPVEGVPYACPTNRGDALTVTNTTHPDQHAAIYIPHSDGSVTLVVGNDGGVYTQTVAAGADFSSANWGVGANRGFHTLYPYDAVIADDGTAWMGLQDNGTAKIQDVADTNGNVTSVQRQIETLGGDGFFVGVDPRNSNQAYGEYTYGAMSGTKDGGKTWSSMDPPGMSGSTAQFSNPFAVDPEDADHVMIAGNQVDETGSGPGTGAEDWAVVYHLGTMNHPGEDVQPSEGDPVNVDSAIDMVGSNAYVGYCGSCDPLDTAVFGGAPFHSGIATNVGGAEPAQRYQPAGWHIATAAGLPNRYITSIEMDPADPNIVYVTVGGYRRLWTPPGQIDANTSVGFGHLFVSRDAGEHFTDISADLPNYPMNWVRLRGSQVVVASDVGVFIGDRTFICKNAASRSCRHFEVLGTGLPIGQVATVEVNACDPNQLVAAVFGRGVYTYRLGPAQHCAPLPPPPPPAPFLGQKVAGPFGFETGTDGWTTKTNNDAEQWQLRPPGHASAQSFGILPYQDATTATLLSPKFDLTDASHVKVTWWQRTNTEECCDYLSMDWSSDGYVWHTGSSVAGQNAGYPDFTQFTAEFDAPAGALYLRYRMTSDALVSFPPYDGVAVDDILVER
ncbi:MAG: hypothetical protein ABR600_05310 [Actinomycetota bacterium]